MVLDVLSIILTDQNHDGFSSLHNEGYGLGSRAMLHSAERYSQYVGQSLVEDEEKQFFVVRKNLGKRCAIYHGYDIGIMCNS